MSPPSRRTLLGSTAGLLALTAGCVANNSDDNDDPDPGSGSNSDGNGNENGNESANGNESDDTENGEDELATETHQYQQPTPSDNPTIEYVHSRDDADDWLAGRDVGEDTTRFVDDTEFENSRLVSIEAGAPNPCTELAIDSVELSDDVLTVEATVTDQQSPEKACAQQEVTVGALVRATFPDEPTMKLSVTVVDRNGDEYSQSMASGSGSASSSTSVTGSDTASEAESETETEE
ncbi:hypothetical protein [Natrialba asiatica]|uniref:Lipoprotein n=1 Tax=Natrialba asiatica (strain ATCC 700177 / DSM 12278 / JCM 9576 / FERM P-10747 / NBRC 102637 / 172P1) TaxID=29540 RepID=M0AQ18_NATA1|nr:hypothetical protein [Natrialba asiatica]ELZ00630.1 hypothetical protein C481_13339 [Natrialba asiatica DSM 12278]